MKKLCLLLLIALITQACKLDGKSIQYAEYIDHNPKTKNLSLASFMFHDLNSITTQTLSTYALPWKIVIVSMAMSKKTEISKKAIRGLLQTYGFIFPKKIYGWKGDELVPEFDYRPAGIVTGYMSFNAEDKTAKRIEVSNIGCVTCHGGMDYDKNGAPNFNFVAGRTNSSLQIERFYNDVVIAMAKLDQKAFKKSFLKNVLKIFPLISDNEFKTIKFFIPITVKQVKKLLKKYGRATAYEIGETGTTNGLASIKQMLKVNRYKHVTEETNLVSIPSLIKRGFRTSLLVDGSYRHKDGPGRYVEMRKEDVTIEQMNQVTEVAAWFTVGTQGQKPKKAAGNKELMHSLSEYLLEYNGTPFPGKINKVLAIKGSKVYKNQCASCHGDYSKGIQDIELLSFPNTFVHVDVIKTDRVRIDIEDVDKIIDAFNKTKFADFIEGQSNKGYVAPILSGLWATAPYLHNGSVPTLWHLMNPNTRPSKFPVGGHNIDFDKVGVSYKLIKGKNDYDYIPWSQKDVYDINKKGHGNQGHEFPFNKMSPSEKMELIEYLKLI